MTVSALDVNGDWIFGRGRAGYKKGADEVRQNVATRIKCFRNDWFLDINDGIDWYALLGQKNTRDQIVREVEKVVLQTVGVLSIETLEVVPDVTEPDRKKRKLTLLIRFKTIYDDTISEELRIEPA